MPTLEQRADDIAAVMDAAGSSRAAVVAWGEGAAIAAMFAATHPERVLWRYLLDEHHARIRRLLDRFRGTPVGHRRTQPGQGRIRRAMTCALTIRATVLMALMRRLPRGDGGAAG